MAIEESVSERIRSLITEGQYLRGGSAHGTVLSVDHMEKCSGWIGAAGHVVQIVCPNPENMYRKKAEEIASRSVGNFTHSAVGEFTELLKRLLADVQGGLIAAIINRAQAETFDDFLDHGRAYLKAEQVREAGVIVGVVFEDSLRRVSRKNGIKDKDVKLDELISALTKLEVISPTKAKRARAAAHVRTKATHAQWDEFDLKDVNAAIEFTQELIEDQLDN